MSIQDILNSPEFSDLLVVEDAEDYKGWTIYTQEGKTFASIIRPGGITDVLHVTGTTENHRIAMKMRITALEPRS